MTELNGKSLDILQENIAALRNLFPEVCCEDKVDFDKLRQILGDYVDDNKERYNFTWNGKGQSLRLSQTPSMGTLRPCPEDTESKNWDTTQNLYIEGDNLEVLKLLQKSYHGKIKMIYIDPPYNTGNDFVYPDDFSDSMDNYKRLTGQVDEQGHKLSTNTEANGRFHTDWLNMMYPRLKLARSLLTEDGVIFISIDDNEYVNLSKVCDEVFGENNSVASLTIVVKPEGRRYGAFAKTHENVKVYCKNIDYLELNEIEVEGAKYQFFDEKGGFNLKGLRNRNVRAFNSTNRPNLRYPFYVNIHEKDSNGLWAVSPIYHEGWKEIFPSTVDGLKSVWRWGKEKSANQSDELTAYLGNDNEIRVFQKERKLTQTPKTVWANKDIISNKGTAEVQKLLGDGIFDFPKPQSLLATMLSIGINDGDYVLDFFSGSATTAHAVMQLNAEDGGNRRFIMVQLPEPCAEGTEAYKAGYKNICEIGKERIRRAGEKIKAEIEAESAQLKIGEEPKKIPDIGFKVFKLDSSNLKKWQPDYDDLETSLFDSISNYVEGRTEQDVVYEIMLKMGLDLTWPLEVRSIAGKNVYVIGLGALMICLDDEITTDVAHGMAELYKELTPEIWKVVFKDNGFVNDSAKVNVKEILKCAGLDEDSFTTV